MNDVVVSQIRTWVPLVVGLLLARLTEWGITDVDGEALISALTVGLSGAYYALARALEGRFSWARYLLGVSKTPSY
jgi:membrane associated rhomboid family serine protease